MNILEIIDKKSNNIELSEKEINYFVSAYTKGEIADYQMSALLMAIKINGMSDTETFALTDAMCSSGEILNLNELGTTCDKHSTGGVSDTTTLALAPILAVCGVKMLKLSGRGLGFTGGTIDKLEAFTGYNAEIDLNKAKELTKQNGACIISANANLAPADKKIYALRDATSTVESIPLIASSIMSKKLASGADVIILDVKYGNGAFMKTKQKAQELATLMVKIGKHFNKKVDYIIDDMNQPLGYNIGNMLEAYECIEVLKGKKGNLYDVTMKLCAKCINLVKNIDYTTALKLAQDAVSSGKALEKFKTMISAQGGDISLFDGLKLQPKVYVKSTKSGKLNHINTALLGHCVGLLGASRQNLNDKIDYTAGVKTFHKLGDEINVGDTLFEVYGKDIDKINSQIENLISCYTIL